MKNTLHLNLKKQWFEMILSGEKKEEYRDVSKYWVNRICQKYPQSVITGGDISDRHKGTQYDIKKFDTITFSNGYSKDRPQFEIELKDIRIDFGNLNWGASRDTKYFVLELGEIL